MKFLFLLFALSSLSIVYWYVKKAINACYKWTRTFEFEFLFCQNSQTHFTANVTFLFNGNNTRRCVACPAFWSNTKEYLCVSANQTKQTTEFAPGIQQGNGPIVYTSWNGFLSFLLPYNPKNWLLPKLKKEATLASRTLCHQTAYWREWTWQCKGGSTVMRAQMEEPFSLLHLATLSSLPGSSMELLPTATVQIVWVGPSWLVQSRTLAGQATNTGRSTNSFFPCKPTGSAFLLFVLTFLRFPSEQTIWKNSKLFYKVEENN